MDIKEQCKAIKIVYLYEKLVAKPLRKMGKVERGVCPFHTDNGTPNFTIYPETNSWNCFRCGIGGDSIKFYMLIKDCDFKTALKKMPKL